MYLGNKCKRWKDRIFKENIHRYAGKQIADYIYESFLKLDSIFYLINVIADKDMNISVFFELLVERTFMVFVVKKLTKPILCR